MEAFFAIHWLGLLAFVLLIIVWYILRQIPFVLGILCLHKVEGVEGDIGTKTELCVTFNMCSSLDN